MDTDSNLIALAPDHALFARMVCRRLARWEPFDDLVHDDMGALVRGEVCVGGLRYCTNLDEFGVPVIHEVLRAALTRAELP